MTAPRELLFIDVGRVETYFDQITAGADRLVAERTSAWSVAAGLPKLGVEGKESIHFREQTLIEKMSRVDEYIKSTVRFGLIPDRAESDDFGYVTMSARKAILPLGESVLVGKSRITLWLPDLVEAESAGLSVYLLAEGGDRDRDRPDWCSSFTALEFLTRNLWYRRIGALTHNEIHEQGIHELFANDAAEAIKALGGEIFWGRRIRALYRTRHIFVDRSVVYSRESPTGVIGYPIYIESCPAA